MTRKEIEKKVLDGNTEWFYNLYNEENRGEINPSEYKVVYDVNLGDGNDAIIVFEFLNFKGFYVSLEGTYSSWDSTEWHSVFISMPYEFKETRFKKSTLAYQRDLKLDSLLKPE